MVVSIATGAPNISAIAVGISDEHHVCQITGDEHHLYDIASVRLWVQHPTLGKRLLQRARGRRSDVT
jgi:hypothetical protein